ncbi:MAG: BamA/TamA family outer membrane protein [Flavobacteriales bacterium]|nr:BamA/TamA family outer membrane protein [Flavobacteriales bacterium]
MPAQGAPSRPHKVGSTFGYLGRSTQHILSGLSLLLLAGCDPTRRLAADQILVKRNQVELIGTHEVRSSELEAIIKQKPNKRVLAIPFYLNMHNLPDPARMPVWQAKKDARIDRRNERRATKGRAPVPYKRTRAQWLRETVGEPPVILDSTLTQRTADQMVLYLSKEGYFKASVDFTVKLRHRAWWGRRLHRPKAVISYTAIAGEAYRLRGLRHEVDDERIRSQVEADWEKRMIREGQRFDGDLLDQERNRITDDLRNNGYLFFTRDLIQYRADTTVGDRQVDLVMSFERLGAPNDRGLTGTAEGTPHDLRDVYISTFRPLRGSVAPIDTLREGGSIFLYQGRLRFKPKALLHQVFLQSSERFNQDRSARTYRRLVATGAFDRVDINFDTTGTGRPGLADARITLLPARQQSASTEGFVTNRGGALGTSINVGYRHRNILRSLASLQAQMSVGFEAQQRIAGSGGTQESTGDVGALTTFNTLSIGPEVTFSLPRPFAGLFSKSSGSQLLLNALYNFQQRPDFTRNLTKLSAGLQWQESRSNTIGAYPFEVNSIKIPRISAGFRSYLEQARNPVLLNSYTDHLFVSHRGSFVHSTPEASKARDAYYLRSVVEWAGPLPSLISESATDSTGQRFRTVSDVRYAEFIKGELDARWRRRLHDRSSVALRVAGGAALPYGNLGVLPFESSFFVGGANGLRAWRARSVGPGSFSEPLVAFDRIGEMRLEANAEYRFKLIGFLEGALFVDAGNVWNLRENPRQPGGAISSEFLSELAVGTGAGARFNFDFFIVRIDVGLQTKDPSLPKGERWLYEPKEQHEARVTELLGSAYRYRPEVNFNLGIGYPF